MFIRTTFSPAASARAVFPTMYFEFDEPSSPWTSTTVSRSRRTASGCQWQWHSTRLGPYPATGPSTSTTSSSGSGSVSRRGR